MLLTVGFVTLVAVMVYEPAVLGAVKVVLVPFTLCTGAKEPAAGLRLQVTPEGSLVATERLAVWPIVNAVARGEMATEISDGATGKVEIHRFLLRGNVAVGDREGERIRSSAPSSGCP